MQVEVLLELLLGLPWADFMERHVGNYHVLRVVSNQRLLEALSDDLTARSRGDRVHAHLRIEQRENLCRHLIQLDGAPDGALCKVLRLGADVVADPASRFQRSSAFESQLLDHLPLGVDDGRRGVVSVQDRTVGRVVFLVGQALVQLSVRFSPLLIP